MLNTTTPSKLRASKYFGVYLSVTLFVISFGLGILVGQVFVVNEQKIQDGAVEKTVKLINLDRLLNKSDEVEFKQFWEVWDRIKEKYVRQPIDDTELFYGAIQGLVMALGDPYSVYMPPQTAEEFSKDLSGELEGIGAEIGIKNNELVVISPLPDSPAEKSGLRPGDKILMIDGEVTAGMDVGTAVGKIRGEGGTQVVLTITRNGFASAQEITITRAKIIVPSVMYTAKPGNIAYIRVMQFNQDTTDILNKYIKRIKAENVQGIILDLRGNPGGYLDASIEMASEWVEEGVIVSERGIGDVSKNHFSSGSHRLGGIKTIVLVNGGSASASEIVAGALQDHKKAIIVGEKTYGKGSVQDFETFIDGSALKLTVAEWYTPNGKNINKEGITPDIIIEEDWENTDVGEDLILEKALELLK